MACNDYVPRDKGAIPLSPAERTVVSKTRSRKICYTHLPWDQAWNAVGIIRLPIAKERRLEAVWATVTLKFCSKRFKPPRKKLMPITSNKLDSMLPMREVWTMTISSLNKARIDTINSTAFLILLECKYPKSGRWSTWKLPKCGIQQTAKSFRGSRTMRSEALSTRECLRIT